MVRKRPWEKGANRRKKLIDCRRCKLKSLVNFGDICDDCITVEKRLYARST